MLDEVWIGARGQGRHLQVFHDGDDAIDSTFWHFEFELAGAFYDLFRYGPHSLV